MKLGWESHDLKFCLPFDLLTAVLGSIFIVVNRFAFLVYVTASVDDCKCIVYDFHHSRSVFAQVKALSCVVVKVPLLPCKLFVTIFIFPLTLNQPVKKMETDSALSWLLCILIRAELKDFEVE